MKRFVTICGLTFCAFGMANWLSGALRSLGPMGFPRFGFPFQMMEGGNVIFDWHPNLVSL